MIRCPFPALILVIAEVDGDDGGEGGRMSHLIARILLAVLMMPLAGVVYLVASAGMMWVRNFWRGEFAFYFAGLATWAFMGAYWWLLWRGMVKFTGQRIIRSLGAVVLGLVGGIAAGFAVLGVDDVFGVFVGSITAPLIWLVGTIFAWRETPAERGARLGGGENAVACPQCGYNLTGLSESRCPECGRTYTLNELFDSQPSRTIEEIA